MSERAADPAFAAMDPGPIDALDAWTRSQWGANMNWSCFMENTPCEPVACLLDTREQHHVHMMLSCSLAFGL